MTGHFGGMSTITKRDLIELKHDMLKWMIGLALAQVGLLVGMLVKLGH